MTLQRLGNTSAAITFTRSFTYTSLNLPVQINQTRAGSNYTYQYTRGADHE